MSEASYEKQKQESDESRRIALSAKYQLLRLSETTFAVITSTSWCPTKGKEFSEFNFVPGLRRVGWNKAHEAIHALNSGEKTEEDYA